MSAIPRLSVRALKKSFGTNTVLRGVDLALEAGEIHALIGGNGAGKSTLSKIIAGLEACDAGELLLDGAPFAPASRGAAQAAGVVMVLQELSVLPTLTIAENLFLGDLPSRRGIIDHPRLLAAARSALVKVGLGSLDPETSASELGVGHQQLVEIAAALVKDCRVLVLDEPTAALSGAEVATLFSLLRELRGNGTAIVYITHRLDELAELADRVSVLRDGELVATLPIAEANRARLISLMAGTAYAASTMPARVTSTSPALRVRGLRGVTFAVNRGEIVGLGGLVGAGRTELLRAIYGVDRARDGEVFLGDETVPFKPASTREAVARGFAFVPEDRKQHGILAPLSVRSNASLPLLPQRTVIPGWIDAAQEAGAVGALLAQLQVRYASAEQPIAQLSGGNQQKIVIGRWLRRDVRVWLLDEPTRGVDVASRTSIYVLLQSLAAKGAAVLVASGDYEELVTLCDRVLVLSNGRLTAAFTRETLNPTAFMAAALKGFDGGPSPRN